MKFFLFTSLRSSVQCPWVSFSVLSPNGRNHPSSFSPRPRPVSPSCLALPAAWSHGDCYQPGKNSERPCSSPTCAAWLSALCLRCLRRLSAARGAAQSFVFQTASHHAPSCCPSRLPEASLHAASRRAVRRHFALAPPFSLNPSVDSVS